jgi:hypothetical protein
MAGRIERRKGNGFKYSGPFRTLAPATGATDGPAALRITQRREESSSGEVDASAPVTEGRVAIWRQYTVLAKGVTGGSHQPRRVPIVLTETVVWVATRTHVILEIYSHEFEGVRGGTSIAEQAALIDAQGRTVTHL